MAADSGPADNGMIGFDPEYASIEEYTLRSSQKIWQDKALGLIYTHYAHNVSVFIAATANTTDATAVLEHAIRTLAAIPDLRLNDHEVISSEGSKRISGFASRHGFWSSLRVTAITEHQTNIRSSTSKFPCDSCAKTGYLRNGSSQTKSP